MQLNTKARYYTPPGSYDGAVKIKGRWVRAVELNRINKDGWVRWCGPPSKAIEAAIRQGTPTPAAELLPELALVAKLPKCDWCPMPAVQYLMGQPFCSGCSKEFAALHASVNQLGGSK